MGVEEDRNLIEYIFELIKQTPPKDRNETLGKIAWFMEILVNLPVEERSHATVRPVIITEKGHQQTHYRIKS